MATEGIEIVACPNCGETAAITTLPTTYTANGEPIRWFSCQQCRFFWCLPRPKGVTTPSS